MLEIIGFVLTLVLALVFANYLDKIHKDELKRERKLNREDLALHDLTACREDVKPVSYTGYHNVTGRF